MIRRQGATRERFNWADEADEMEIEHTMSFGYVDPEPTGGWTYVDAARGRGRRGAGRGHIVEENEVLMPISNRFQPIAPHRQNAYSPAHRQTGFRLPDPPGVQDLLLRRQPSQRP